jgi:Matrixin
MRQAVAVMISALFLMATIADPSARGYSVDTTIPLAGGCPRPDLWGLSIGSPLDRQWSTSLPLSPATILTAAASGTSAQLTEIEQAISDSFGTWSGVTGTTFNATSFPGMIGPLSRVTDASACSNDQENNVDGLNTICFNQASMGFTSGVLAFTRVVTANAAGASVGSSAIAAFAGQILDSDTLFRNDGQATFATPAGLATASGQGAYDLESLLIHELGHWFGLDHSAVIRAMMFPFAPPPGQFLGDRPTAQAPDGPLADDDRTGVRVQYPDPADTVNVGVIQGRILPANPFALAALAAPSPGSSVTGIFGAHVVAADAGTGAVIAGTLGGWSCNPANPPTQFDGSYRIERLPVGHSYNLYAEPLVGIAAPSDFGISLGDLCNSGGSPECTTPALNTNFNVRILPVSP